MALFNLSINATLLAAILLILLGSPSQAAKVEQRQEQDQCNPANDHLTIHDCAVYVISSLRQGWCPEYQRFPYRLLAPAEVIMTTRSIFSAFYNLGFQGKNKILRGEGPVNQAFQSCRVCSPGVFLVPAKSTASNSCLIKFGNRPLNTLVDLYLGDR
jgi:hypothetical protein